MQPTGRKHTRSAPGHQECATCHPATKAGRSSDRARIRRETWEEAARWCEHEYRALRDFRERTHPTGERLAYIEGKEFAYFHAMDTFRRRAEEEGERS